MTTLNIQTLEQGKKIGLFDQVILFKMQNKTFIYEFKNAQQISLYDILLTFFKENTVVKFTVTCNEDQHFLPRLHFINGFKVSGVLQNGESFEIDFNHFAPEAEELLKIDVKDSYIDEKQREWTTTSTIDTQSDVYLFLKEQAISCNMYLSHFDAMLNEVAKRCTGSEIQIQTSQY